MMYRSVKDQRGVVLIMALLIVVLVTTVVVQVSWRFHLSMARNENRWHGAQARSYLEGGEQLARKILIEDAAESQYDWLGEMWAEQGQPLPTDEGWVRGQLEDGHGRFNLNTLLPPAQANPGTGGQQNNNNRRQRSGQNPQLTPEEQYSAQQRRFIRFLQTIELENGPMDLTAALELVAAITDWIDPDNNVTQGPLGGTGAENSFYESQDPPVFISNTWMTSVSELSQIRGVTPELYKKLEPFVVALPPENFAMNINTMRPELLRAFNRKEDLYPLDEASWATLVEARNAAEEGIPEVSMFVDALITAGMVVDANEFDVAGLDTRSYYFIYTGETLVGEQVRRSKSLLFRNGANVAVVRRTDGSF